MTAVRVGLCGFSMAMRSYASQFPVVEVQSTFYDPPSTASIEFDFGEFTSHLADEDESNELAEQEEQLEDENGDAHLPKWLLARLDPDVENKATLCEFLLEGKPIFRSTDWKPQEYTATQWLERVQQRWQRLGRMPKELINDAHVDAALAQSALAMRHVPEVLQSQLRIKAALIKSPQAFWLLSDDNRDDPNAVFAIQQGLYIGQFAAEAITPAMCDAAIARDRSTQVGIPPQLVSPSIVIQLVMLGQHPNSFPTSWQMEKIIAELPAYLNDTRKVRLQKLKEIEPKLPGVFKTAEVLAVLHQRLGK